MRSLSLDNIPPTSAVFKQYILRASYQGSHVLGQVHLTLPELPIRTEWGWERNSQCKPLWPTYPQVQQRCYELIYCFCKEACKWLCNCSKVNLHCTALCACGQSHDSSVSSGTHHSQSIWGLQTNKKMLKRASLVESYR